MEAVVTKKVEESQRLQIDSVPKLTHRELLYLRASVLSASHPRLGPHKLLIEMQVGQPDRKRPLFLVGALFMAKHLPEDQPVYGLPFGSKQENVADYLRALAGCYVEHIRSVQPTGPYLLCGFCAGGWTVLEMAHQLRQAGEQVGLLMMVESRGVTRDFTFLYPIFWHLGEIGRGSLKNRFGHAAKLLTGDGLWRRLMRKRHRKEATGLLKDEVLQMWLAQETLRPASQAWTPPLWDGPAVYIYAQAGHFRSTLYPKAGWGRFLTGAAEFVPVPGDHTTYIQEPHVHVLAQTMQRYLERASVEREL